MERHSALTSQELAYSSPMSLSEKDANRVRKKIMELVQEINKIREHSDCDQAYCLNIDWLKF